jgi:hypothetical protein
MEDALAVYAGKISSQSSKNAVWGKQKSKDYNGKLRFERRKSLDILSDVPSRWSLPSSGNPRFGRRKSLDIITNAPSRWSLPPESDVLVCPERSLNISITNWDVGEL